MMILLPLLVLALTVGAVEVPCVDGLLLGPDTALVGVRQPEHTKAETVRFNERVFKNYAARVCQDTGLPHPASYAFATAPGQGACRMKKPMTNPKEDGFLHITIKEGHAWLVTDRATVDIRGGQGPRSYGAFGVVATHGSHVTVDNLQFDAIAPGFPFVMRSDHWLRRLWPDEYDAARYLEDQARSAYHSLRRAWRFSMWMSRPHSTKYELGG
jgi:hypothetical protein